ncbi:hypothetical protein F1880_008000 [Penicillium rolfsii]|nr:hypothetical protein F1880_008000 [Penicillium rolfsii]
MKGIESGTLNHIGSRVREASLKWPITGVTARLSLPFASSSSRLSHGSRILAIPVQSVRPPDTRARLVFPRDEMVVGRWRGEQEKWGWVRLGRNLIA